MIMQDLGINSDGIHFEVALELLGQRLQPFIQAIQEEKTKAAPSLLLIRYYEMRVEALDELQGSLTPKDMDAVQRIFDKQAAFQIA